MVAGDEPIDVRPLDAEFVSRGGFKLAAGLDAFGVAVRGRRCVDAGASTGGFTDCLLQRGAAEVVAIDVGRGQLAWSLRNDPRVEVRDRTNIRYLTPGDVMPAAEVVVADLSFISLRTAASGLLAVGAPDVEMVLLVKPQFEARRELVAEGGVVRSPELHLEVLSEVVEGLASLGIVVVEVARSPLHGAGGNVEFLAHGRRAGTMVADAPLARVVEVSAAKGT